MDFLTETVKVIIILFSYCMGLHFLTYAIKNFATPKNTEIIPVEVTNFKR